MKIFGINFGKQVQPLTQSVVIPTLSNDNLRSVAQSFSTPLMKIGKGNLTQPKVDSFYHVNGYVKFGDDNLYPQLLDQMYYTSPLHGSIINFITNAVIGIGYEWIGDNDSAFEKIKQKQLDRKLPNILRETTINYIIHNRVYFEITDNGGQKTIKQIGPAKVRTDLNASKFVISEDWSKGMAANRKERKPFKYGSNCDKSIIEFKRCSPGTDVYPIPSYNSILNWLFLDGEISYIEKAALQNSAFPSLIVRVPKEFKSQEEVDSFKAGFISLTETDNAGKIAVVSGNGFDLTPEVTQMSYNTMDGQFSTISKEIKDQICFGHMINPTIMGIKVTGSLGNSEELNMSYAIFEKNVVSGLRTDIENIINEILEIEGLTSTIKIVAEKIVDGGDDIVSGYNQTNGDIINYTPKVNDNLKGLSAGENNDMYRIVRDHSKGKINDILAIKRLNGYGLSDDDAKQILGLK